MARVKAAAGARRRPSTVARLASTLATPLRASLRRQLVALLSRGGGPQVDYDAPAGDRGLFGPDSVTWTIHADFPGMMAGGVCALMLQTLHPLALAGVWDHSNFRTDILGRLRRTTAFVAGTTYGPRAAAEQMIQRVRAIHKLVRGTAPDGRAYAADDPALLTWVHVTETWSFLQGYRTFMTSELPPERIDAYFDETRRVARALGARRVPGSALQVERYFNRIQPQLKFDERSQAVLDVLRAIELPVPASPLFRDVFVLSGSALLPQWARLLMGLPPAPSLRERWAVRSLKAAAPSIRAALSEGVAARSCRRVGVSPRLLTSH